MGETMIQNDTWHTYPKIFAIGHAAIDKIFEGNVIVEEKVDGSQFSFGVYDGKLRVRSKGVEFDPSNPEKMFTLAVETAKKLEKSVMPGWRYVCEFLMKPKHNTLKYERVPKGNLILLDVLTGNEHYLSMGAKLVEANRIGLEVVPELSCGRFEEPAQLFKLLDKTSILGGAKIEGIVIKAYSKFTGDGKAMMGKFVGEEFKENHVRDWKSRHPGETGLITKLILTYKTEARWMKAVQHLRDRGELENAPKDIGALVKEISVDTAAECEDEIKEVLFAWAWPKIARGLKKGFPEWYKRQLVESAFLPDDDSKGVKDANSTDTGTRVPAGNCQ